MEKTEEIKNRTQKKGLNCESDALRVSEAVTRLTVYRLLKMTQKIRGDLIFRVEGFSS